MLWNPNEPEAKAPKADGIQGRNQRDEIFKYPKVFELKDDDDEDYDDDYETTVVRKRRQDRDSNYFRFTYTVFQKASMNMEKKFNLKVTHPVSIFYQVFNFSFDFPFH